MNIMEYKKASDVRKDWSANCDEAVRVRPNFFRRTRDTLVLTSTDDMALLLQGYSWTADRFVEKDGSVTLSLNEIDLAENAPTEEESRAALGAAVLEYAEEYYENYDLYSRAPNRRGHAPYVMKALICGRADRIGKEILCRDGKN